jgi:hypothetical protein
MSNVHPNPNSSRFSSQHAFPSLKSGTAVVLQHVITRVAMLADPKQTEYTDFGSECEVVCQIKANHNVVSSLAREAKGSAIVSVPLEGEENHWLVNKVL